MLGKKQRMQNEFQMGEKVAKNKILNLKFKEISKVLNFLVIFIRI